MSKTSDQQEKDARARMRAAFDLKLDHVRAGSWNGLEGAEVRVVGLVSELHGSVCTCCPRRTQAGAA